MTAVDQALAEVVAAAQAIAPQHEGLRDLARLNLDTVSEKHVRVAISQYDRRVELMEAARSALAMLLADGYPDLLVRPLPPAVFDDLQDQVTTITAAIHKFVPVEEAIDLQLHAGEPELK